MAISWWAKKVYDTFACIIVMQKRISKISNRFQNQGHVNHLSTFDPELRNVSFALISFMGFPSILSALQPFQICIFKRKYSKLTFSNGSQLIKQKIYYINISKWKRFMAHLHASLESICKSRISKISTRCQNQEGKVNHLSPCPG